MPPTSAELPSPELGPSQVGHWNAMPTLSTIRCLILFLLLVAANVHAEVERVTILHLNDLHARLLPDEQGRGGFAHVATAIESQRRTSKNPIVLHAGDMVQGSPVSTIFEGTPVFEVANSLGIDAHCLGNHEFDYGWERIADFVRVSHAPILAANVIDDRGKRLVPPAVELEAGNLKVAVIGALTPRLRQLVKPGQIGPWRVAPLVDSLNAQVSEMHERVDLIVVLSHLFDDEDELILRSIPDVDVVVGGHNHGGWETELIVEGRVGVKLRPYGRELGRLEIGFDTDSERVVDHRWTRIPIHRIRYAASPETAALVDVWESKVSERVDIAIGRSERSLDRSSVKALVEQAILESTGADLAYMNRGGVRDSIGRGTITARHVWNILPFDNKLVEATVLGSDLPEEAVRGRTIEPSRPYRFVTNDYVAGLAQYRRIRFRDTDHLLRDTFLDWVKARKTIP